MASPTTGSRGETLLGAVAAGDARAVELLVDRYSPLVWSIVRRQVDHATAEDIVQDVFLQVWRGADRFDPEKGSEATFITTIARRRLIDRRRRRGARPPTEELGEQLAEQPPETVESALELRDEAEAARRALASLRPAQRRVLEMNLIEGRSHGEIAEATALPLGTVKSHARRGLERLRELLGEGGAT
jgi:RNA polymerase sigma-70 factor (ECF subfamily)